MNRARSNLAKARLGYEFEGVYLEDLCFDAQQAAERALKAVLIHLGTPFPYVHDLSRLLSLIEESGIPIPEDVKEAAILTDYAVSTRYPGLSEPVSLDEYREAMALAARVLTWAQGILGAEG